MAVGSLGTSVKRRKYKKSLEILKIENEGKKTRLQIMGWACMVLMTIHLQACDTNLVDLFFAFFYLIIALITIMFVLREEMT